jgi:maltose/moltooligosaccharide transporter
MIAKPRLSLSKILQMNLGFLGLQFSFGLQQANMGPIWGYLGAEEKNFPFLLIAGPLSGLIVQPIIGAMSDRTSGRWGRRAPYFLIGAVMCSLGLLFMPLSNAIWMAFLLLFLLDVGNNVTMEPYRAYVNDRLNPDQRGFGFLSQSAFTGLAQTLAYLAPSILVGFGVSQSATASGGIPYFVLISFWIGASLSLSTIAWSLWRVPELPLTVEERTYIEAQPKSARATFAEIWSAIREMPVAMRTMAWMSLFQWYAMVCYWNFINNSVARSVFNTADDQSDAFRSAQLLYGKVGAFYNFVAFLTAFMMPALARRFGAARLHAACLLAAAASMLTMPYVSDPAMLFFAAVGMGLGWASIMGNPYIILANSIPPERTGVYMGIFNMMICAPMLLWTATLPALFGPLLHNDPRNVILFGGVLMILAAIAVSRVKGDSPVHAPTAG